MNSSPNQLHIVQLNAHRSKDLVMATFLRNPDTLKADIIAIQEPWANPFQDTTHHPAQMTHQLLYPKQEQTGGRARVCLMVRKSLTGWQHTVLTKDLQLLSIHYYRGQEPQTLHIYNIYNEKGSNTIQQLRNQLQSLRAESIVLGDLNLHHPAWGGHEIEIEPESLELIEAADEASLELLTEPGTVTWQLGDRGSTIDLTFTSRSLLDRLILWERADDISDDSDHYPIRTILDIKTPVQEPVKRRNWKATDTKKLIEFVTQNAVYKDLKSANKEQINQAVDHLIEVIQQGINNSVPWAKPSLFANPDFSPECSEAVKGTRRLRRLYTLTHAAEDWGRYTAARNAKKRLVQKALKQGHRKRVREVTEAGPAGLWRLAKWARNRDETYEQGIIPTLKHGDGQQAETATEKAKVFQELFFPKPPPADLSDLTDEPRFERWAIEFPNVTEQEVLEAIQNMSPDKAPGPDGIPNRLLHLLAPIITPILTQIFDACVRLGYNPSHFQDGITVAMKKPGKRDLRIPKSYRPVALLNTIAKVLEAVIAQRISYAVERYKLLPNTHLGGRKAISTDHALQLIIQRIREAWGRRRLVSMLLLDVSGAYDNVSHERLLYNMKKRRLGQLVPWLASYLSNRRTRIRMPDHTTDWISTPNGIPQGSPLSPILYLIYNADLVQDCSDGPTFRGLVDAPMSTTAFAWVDDVAILIEAPSETYIHKLLLNRHDIALEWSRTHASVFAPSKYELIHFENPLAKKPRQARELVLPTSNRETVTVKPSQEARYLGVWLDPHLTFEAHRKRAIGKAIASLDALKGLSGSTWGTSLGGIRRLYQAVIIPQMLYCSAAWFNPKDPGIPTKTKNLIYRQFSSIQKQAALLISGAFKGTAAKALDIELHLTPIKLQFQQRAEETLIRIASGPSLGRPGVINWNARRPESVKLGGKTPTELHYRAKGGCLSPLTKEEEVWECREAFIKPPWIPGLRVAVEGQEQAINTHNITAASPEQAILYSDGSGHQGQIGAAAVAPALGATKAAWLGPETAATVYAAELNGIALAAEILEEQVSRQEASLFSFSSLRKATIFSDSQAGIKALGKARGQPSGQIYLKRAFESIRKLENERNIEVTIRWIPGHQGILGNEAADQAAKQAATAATAASNPSRICRLAAAAKRAVRDRVKQAWAKSWAATPRGKPTKRLVPAPDVRVVKGLYRGMSKAYSSVLIQLRTGRIGLNHFLYKIKARESDDCSCEQGSQTPKHVLFDCPLWTEIRQQMWDKMGGRKTDYDDIIKNPKLAKHAADFFIRTGLLGQFKQAELTSSSGSEPLLAI
jgi:ribonuclease HI